MREHQSKVDPFARPFDKEPTMSFKSQARKQAFSLPASLPAMRHQIQLSIPHTSGHFDTIQTRERPQRWLSRGGQTGEPTALGIPSEDPTALGIPHHDTGRAHSAGYPIGKSHSAGYFRVKVAYSAGNPRSRDTKHESIVDLLAGPVDNAFKNTSSLRPSSNSRFQQALHFARHPTTHEPATCTMLAIPG